MSQQRPQRPQDELPEAPPVPRRKGEKADDEAPPPPPKWRGWVGRILLVIAAVLLIVEVLAQTSFKKHLKICQDAIDTKNSTPVKFDEIKEKFSVQPTKSSGVHSFAKADIYSWGWQGVRTYKLRLFANPADGTLIDVESQP